MRIAAALTLLLFLSASAVAARGGEFVVANEGEFAKCISKDATVKKLADGMAFTEGPVWLADNWLFYTPKDREAKTVGYLVFSDIPADELRGWSADGGLFTVRKPSRQTNGNASDRDSRLVCAEHASRSVTRTKADGKVETVADRFEGKRFNSPNDVVVKSDGTFYFTDPPYGLPKGEQRELDFNGVYRVDPTSGKVTLLTKDVKSPNGLCFSPDEKRLYVANSDGKDAHVMAFDVKEDGALGEGTVFCRIDKGAPDGIRCDADGRLWSSAGDGVHVFGTDGQLIGKVLVPEAPANLCFGGDDKKTLFITARKSLYSVRTNVAGARTAGKGAK